MTEERTAADTSISAVCDGIGRLLEVSPASVRRVRLNANGVEAELDWSADAAPAPAAAGAAVATGPASDGGPARTPGGAGPAAEAEPDRHLLLAPLVGTYYHAPEPGAAPFVAEGDTVQAGQQVGVMEVMKMMVPIEADQAGTVIGHLVPDGEPAEFGRPLLALAPHDDR
ncbi:acetyl-CoA carboxylase biotin carboxyl carrier protein [Nocardiopsis halophila]|uniref:acetyl-CoA carboxylase biotin carboxyl carrier protein n=1 Tax=Nocardiopsis halophila TaxID=141692 RepID=UPI0003480B48|nr:biotin/lipoyl-containing protein [Nocardiopsis halophila]